MCLALVGSALAYPQSRAAPKVKEFDINLQKEVPRMLELVKETRLPRKTVVPGNVSSVGISLDALKDLRKKWLHDFDWAAEQAKMNEYHHFTTRIEGIDIHFMNELSSDANAIPLILLHGWPGSFLELLPLVEPLTQTAKTSTGQPISFHLVIPSLPGHVFSGPPPAVWTVADTARIFDTLMTDVLGYKTYAVHGTDWGSAIGYSMYEQFNRTTRALHTPFLPFASLSSEQLAARNISLSAQERFQVQRAEEFFATGAAYFQEQATKPNTIGLALQDNPVGQLAWIGEKFIDWSDPRAGTGVSVLDDTEILRSISLYYLTQSFASSVFIYQQNGWRTEYTRPLTDAPLLHSSFKYNVGFWPRAVLEEVGNLVYYKLHDFGGHFPGVDNPPALITDIREIGNNWERP